MKFLSPKIITILVLLVAGIVFIPFLKASYIGSFSAGSKVDLVVQEQSTVQAVAELLTARGIIASVSGYRWYGRLLNDQVNHPKAGTYHLMTGTSYRTVARLLSEGPTREEAQVRLIEGKTIDQEIEELTKQGVKEKETIALPGRSRDKAPFDASLRASFAFLTGLPRTRSLEGYAFPETYRVWKDELPGGLIKKQLQEFDHRFGDAVVGSQSAPLKTLDQVVILASIVEKEVADPAERKMVAGIFLGRLQIGMPLQSDATMTYAIGSGTRPSLDELQKDSPYNTYKYRGLPPGPICNPGASSIEAVLNPTITKYRYFLTDPEGRVLYGVTLEDHIRNRRKAGY